VRLPVETLKVVKVAFADTVTETGAVNMGAALFETVTTAPPVGAAFERVTVQAAVALAPRLAGVHCKDETRTGATREMVVEAEDPLSEAVRVAVWLVESVPVEMLKVAEVALAAAVTDVGAVNAGAPAFVNATTAPPVVVA